MRTGGGIEGVADLESTLKELPACSLNKSEGDCWRLGLGSVSDWLSLNYRDGGTFSALNRLFVAVKGLVPLRRLSDVQASLGTGRFFRTCELHQRRFAYARRTLPVSRRSKTLLARFRAVLTSFCGSLNQRPIRPRIRLRSLIRALKLEDALPIVLHADQRPALLPQIE